jgi:integrase/recombinase XerD
LIAVTGLRINEAIALDEGDVDLGERVITVKRGKNGTAPLRTAGAEHGR